MLTTKTNFHRSKMPSIGSLGYLVRGYERYTNKPLYLTPAKAKVQVIAYNLNDNTGPYSVGQHLIHIQNLATGAIDVVAHQYFEAV